MSITIRPARVVIVKVAEFLSGSPIAHKGGAVGSHGSGEGDIRVALRIDRSSPDIRCSLQDTVDHNDAVFLLWIEEYAVDKTALNEIKRPFVLMSTLAEAHLLPLPAALL
jgi:hypothetical protein